MEKHFRQYSDCNLFCLCSASVPEGTEQFKILVSAARCRLSAQSGEKSEHLVSNPARLLLSQCGLLTALLSIDALVEVSVCAGLARAGCRVPPQPLCLSPQLGRGGKMQRKVPGPGLGQGVAHQ